MAVKFMMKDQKEENLQFSADIDREGDFIVRISLDGKEWTDLLYVDSTDGVLELLCGVGSEFKKYIATDERGAIKIG